MAIGRVDLFGELVDKDGDAVKAPRGLGKRADKAHGTGVLATDGKMVSLSIHSRSPGSERPDVLDGTLSETLDM